MFQSLLAMTRATIGSNHHQQDAYELPKDEAAQIRAPWRMASWVRWTVDRCWLVKHAEWKHKCMVKWMTFIVWFIMVYKCRTSSWNPPFKMLHNDLMVECKSMLTWRVSNGGTERLNNGEVHDSWWCFIVVTGERDFHWCSQQGRRWADPWQGSLLSKEDLRTEKLIPSRIWLCVFSYIYIYFHSRLEGWCPHQLQNSKTSTASDVSFAQEAKFHQQAGRTPGGWIPKKMAGWVGLATINP